MPRVHPHYVNTRFDAPHADASGQSEFVTLNKDGGLFVTQQEYEEYDNGGWLFDKVGFDK